jgi:hypothetical protein
MSQTTPPPPESMPEQPSLRPSSRYHRPRRYISWAGLLIGLILGLAGGLYYAWMISPVIETDTSPAQLRPSARDDYMVAVALAFSYDSDLSQAIARLSRLDLDRDPLQAVAETACDLAQSGYANNTSGLRALRSMKTFYQLQGRSGCADDVIPDIEEERVVAIDVPTPTPTLPPPPTKTPVVQVTATSSGIVVVPTSPPQRTFTGRITGTYCNTQLSGLIEVRVISATGQPLPGQPVRVRWSEGEDRFVTGIKPERGADYGDFQMQDGISYIVDMPGLSDPLSGAIVADGCTTENGESAITSYRVTFRRSQ